MQSGRVKHRVRFPSGRRPLCSVHMMDMPNISEPFTAARPTSDINETAVHLILESTDFGASVSRRWNLEGAPKVETYLPGHDLFTPAELQLYWSDRPGGAHFSGHAWPDADHPDQLASAWWSTWDKPEDHGVAPAWVSLLGEQLYADLHDAKKTAVELPFKLTEVQSYFGASIDERWVLADPSRSLSRTPAPPGEPAVLRVSWDITYGNLGPQCARYRVEIRKPGQRALNDWGGTEDSGIPASMPDFVQELLYAALDRVMKQPAPNLRLAAEFVIGS